jgi:hypothetical protein
MNTKIALVLVVLLATCGGTKADQPSYGPELEGFDYPLPVQRFGITSHGQSLSMAFLDVAPDTPNGRTVVLLHGKNFCAATWEATIRSLAASGYRVIALLRDWQNAAQGRKSRAIRSG